jgi:hypothetical protein
MLPTNDIDSTYIGYERGWATKAQWSDEAEDGPPSAPKRAASDLSDVDYEWLANCAHVVLTSDPVLSQISTDWTKHLRQITYEAKKAAAQEELRRYTNYYRLELEYWSMRLAATATGKALHKKRKTAEMNARYERKNGKRVYVGKKKTTAKKRRRADAAIARRARKRATTHGDIPATDDTFWYENQYIAAAAEAKALVTQSKRIQL